MVDWMKRKSLESLSVGNLNEALSYIKTSIGGAHTSSQPERNAKQHYKISTFFELKKHMPMTLLSEAIAFFATELLDNFEKIPSTGLNEARY